MFESIKPAAEINCFVLKRDILNHVRRFCCSQRQTNLRYETVVDTLPNIGGQGDAILAVKKHYSFLLLLNQRPLF